MDKHVCGYEPVSCKYAKVGCKVRPPRRDLKVHEENDQLHIRVTTEKVLELTKKVALIENKARMDIAKVNSQLLKSTSTVPRTIKLTNYLKYKSDNDLFYSPSFYTSYTGYKMCLKVAANGLGTCEGTHVSVFSYIMKGDNDDSLSWPFPGIVTYELLNQLEDKNHYKMRLTFPADNACSRRVVDRERSIQAYGQQKFISHADLDYNASKNTQYLKDDTLVFRVSVQVPDYKSWLE